MSPGMIDSSDLTWRPVLTKDFVPERIFQTWSHDLLSHNVSNEINDDPGI